MKQSKFSRFLARAVDWSPLRFCLQWERTDAFIRLLGPYIYYCRTVRLR